MQSFEIDLGGRKLTVEHGKMAKQANGAVLVRYGDTVVLVTATASKEAKDIDFFPLTVNYQEKLYSVGKIPGGFIKREGRASEAATLAARLIDRPMRPLFPEDFKNEVQIISTVLSVDPDCDPALTAMIASSLAVSISKIPFNGPIAGVKVGRVDGKLVINPTVEQSELSDINLTVAGTKEAINMVESSAKQVKEDDMLEALLKGHEAIKELVEFEETIIKEIGVEKMEYETLTPEKEIVERVEKLVTTKMNDALHIKEKLVRYQAIDDIKEEVVDLYTKENEDKLKPEELAQLLVKVKMCLSNVEYNLFRNIVVKEKLRADGRKMDEIRPLSTDIDMLPRTHGSALFTRGETQSLAITTLGTKSDEQLIDDLEKEYYKKFYLHYNFPPYSVGEVGRMGSPGRRELGHGSLAERALRYVIPSEEEFPYTIRVVSEITESNGSSSQASICGGSLSLMSAGVPIKEHVAGIAMGLIKEGEEFTVLTDIMGLEDHLGDMDFKVAGTKDGITALQMDIKIDGISREILATALEKAKRARLHILSIMNDCIATPSEEMSKYAPKIFTMQILPEKIREVIGPGGKVINKIIDETGVKIDTFDDGRIAITADSRENGERAKEMINEIVKEIEVGEIYSGVITTITNFGAFVELIKGKEGLLHISNMTHERLNKVEDLFKVGDVVEVKVIEIDNQGKIKLSRKALLEKPKKDKEKEEK